MEASSLIGGLSARLCDVPDRVEQQTPGLLRALAQVPDPRDPRGRIHPLPGLLAIAASAVAAGQSTVTEIAEWAADLPDTVLTRLGAARDPFTGVRLVPDDSTFTRVLAAVDADALDTAICQWLITAQTGDPVPGRRAIAVDGKTLRGTGQPGTQVHLLAAIDQRTGVVLAQTDVDGKTNEITRFAPLLDTVDLTDTVVTADALHTQREHARWLIETKKAGYVFTVKRNQCATRRFDTSPLQAGQTRREVCWV